MLPITRENRPQAFSFSPVALGALTSQLFSVNYVLTCSGEEQFDSSYLFGFVWRKSCGSNDQMGEFLKTIKKKFIVILMPDR